MALAIGSATAAAAEPPDEVAVPKPAQPRVTLGTPRFQGGEVPKLASSLQGVAAGIGRCVAKHGGLSSARGLIEARFLVRARGRAEGVETPTVRGASEAAGRCVRMLLKNHPVGAPSEEPVGVTVPFLLVAPDATPKDEEAGPPPADRPPVRSKRLRSAKHRPSTSTDADRRASPKGPSGSGGEK